MDLAVFENNSKSSSLHTSSPVTSDCNDLPSIPTPPIVTTFRVIDSPTIHLVSIDQMKEATLYSLEDCFDLCSDDLSLLRAAIIASGIVPIGLESSLSHTEDASLNPLSDSIPTLQNLLFLLIGVHGKGIELTSHVQNIPKGSRMAVSSSLLGSLIAVCTRATQQLQKDRFSILSQEGKLTPQKTNTSDPSHITSSTTSSSFAHTEISGPLTEEERCRIASRIILGEWIGGSGGGWQDSGGLWSGVKVMCGRRATPSDPEYGLSCGTLLPFVRSLKIFDDSLSEAKICDSKSSQYPQNTLVTSASTTFSFDPSNLPFIPSSSVRAFLDSLVFFHGGQSINIGAILTLVSNKYLLRSSQAFRARQCSVSLFPRILNAFIRGNIREMAALLQTQYYNYLLTVIPSAGSEFTDRLLSCLSEEFDSDFWGLWVLGSSSGGGMGIFIDPKVKSDKLRKRHRKHHHISTNENIQQKEKEETSSTVGSIDIIKEILYECKTQLKRNLNFVVDPLFYQVSVNDTGSVGKFVEIQTQSSTSDDPISTHITSNNLSSLPSVLDSSHSSIQLARTPVVSTCPLCTILSLSPSELLLIQDSLLQQRCSDIFTSFINQHKLHEGNHETPLITSEPSSCITHPNTESTFPEQHQAFQIFSVSPYLPSVSFSSHSALPPFCSLCTSLLYRGFNPYLHLKLRLQLITGEVAVNTGRLGFDRSFPHFLHEATLNHTIKHKQTAPYLIENVPRSAVDYSVCECVDEISTFLLQNGYSITEDDLKEKLSSHQFYSLAYTPSYAYSHTSLTDTLIQSPQMPSTVQTHSLNHPHQSSSSLSNALTPSPLSGISQSLPYYYSDAHIDYSTLIRDYISGVSALLEGRVGCVTLCSRVCSKWTGGSPGVVKATSHVCPISGHHRSFLEVRMATMEWIERMLTKIRNSKNISAIHHDTDQCNSSNYNSSVIIPHTITTSYYTHDAVSSELNNILRDPSIPSSNHSHIYVSISSWSSLRTVPSISNYLNHFNREVSPVPVSLDLSTNCSTSYPIHLPASLISSPQFSQCIKQPLTLTSQKPLPPRYQRHLTSTIEAIIKQGPETDYRENSVEQCMQPCGHLFEIASLIINGTLRRLLIDYPQLQTLFVSNVDSTGTWCDPIRVGHHLRRGDSITFEVMERTVEDKGSFLAMASILQTRQPSDKPSNNSLKSPEKRICLVGEHVLSEEERWKLCFVSTNAFWINIDAFLKMCGLDRQDILDNNQKSSNQNDSNSSSVENEYHPSNKVVRAVEQFLLSVPVRATVKQVRRTKDSTGGEESHATVQVDRLTTDLTHVSFPLTEQCYNNEPSSSSDTISTDNIQPKTELLFRKDQEANSSLFKNTSPFQFGYVCVDRLRGMCLKEHKQLDGWIDKRGRERVEQHTLWKD